MARFEFDSFIDMLKSGSERLSPGLVIFVEDKNNISFVKSLLESARFEKSGCKIVASDCESGYELKGRLKEAAEISGISEYIDWKNSDSETDIKAIELAGAWYKKDGVDYTVQEGISLGDLYHRLSAYWFMDVLRSIAEVKVIAEKEPGKDLIFFENAQNAKEEWIFRHKSYHARIADIMREKGKVNNRIFRLIIPCGTGKSARPSTRQPAGELVKELLYSFHYLYKLAVNIGKHYEKNIMIRYYSDTEQGLLGSLLKEEKTRVVLSALSFGAIKRFFFLKNFICSRIKTNPRYAGSILFKDAATRFEKFKISKSGEFIFEGIDTWPVLEDNFKHLFEREFNNALAGIYSIANEIKKFNIDKVVVDTDIGFEGRKYVFAAKYLKIESVVIQHGAAASDRKADIGYMPFRADKFLAWDKITMSWLRERGIEDKRIRICGSQKIDYILNLAKDKEARRSITERVFRDFGIVKNRRIVLFISQAVGKDIFPNLHIDIDENLNYIQALAGIINDLEDTHLIVKLHPSDPHRQFIERYGKEAGWYSGRMHIVRDYPVDNLILASDMVVSHYSSTIYSAMAAGIPVISANFRRIPFCAMRSFGGKKVLYRAGDKSQLRCLIMSILKDRDERSGYINKEKDFLTENFPDSGSEVKKTIEAIFS